MDTLFEQIKQLMLGYLNLPYLLTFMFLTYAVKDSLKKAINIWISLNEKLNKYFPLGINLTFIALIIGIIIAIPFVLFGAKWQNILFSYSLGTSLHELLFSYIEKKFKS